MLNRFRKWFGDSSDGQALLNRVENFQESEPLQYGEIRQRKNGKFVLLANGNEVVSEYARYRDAIRGADRRGLVVV